MTIKILFGNSHNNVHCNVRTDPVPRLVQYDWVAMFSPEPTQFIEKAMPWIGKRRNTKISPELLNPHLPLSMNIGEKGVKSVKIERNGNRVVQEVAADGSVIEIKKERSDKDGSSGKENDKTTSGPVESQNGIEKSELKNDEKVDEKDDNENEMLKLRVIDVFDRMKDIVIAMNAFGEGKVGELY